MKQVLNTAFAVLYCTFCMAAENWTPYFKSEQIQVFYRYADCHDEANGIHQQKVFLKFVNLETSAVEVSFHRELTYNRAKTLLPDLADFSIRLKPAEQKEGSCLADEKSLNFFSKQLNFTSTELKQFELKNISVIHIQ